MTSKKILLWSTIAASVLLTGTTFAAWAVTDSANPFNITITPETPTIVTDRKAVLNWGEIKAVDFKGMKAGETKGAYEIGLAVTTNTLEAYTGSFEVTMKDDNLNNQNTNKLIDNLTVKVYDKKVDEEGVKTLITVDKNNLTGKADIEVLSGHEKAVYLYVTLADLEDEVMDEIKNDSVTLTVDWNKASEDEAVLANTLYTSKVEGWGEKLYAYVWDEGSGDKAADWPGVEMTAVEGTNYFKYDVGTQYNKIIFNDGGDHQTDNLDITNEVRISTPYYDIAEKKWYTPQEEVEVEYYVTGLIGGVNKWYTTAGFVPELKMNLPAPEDEQNIAVKENLALKSGDLIKVINNVLIEDAPTYYGAGTNVAADNDNNVMIGEDGNYNIYLSKDQHVYIAKV